VKSTLTFNTREAQVPWPSLLTQQLERWQSLTTIAAAEVVLEQQRGNGRAFRVKVRLEVAGPGLNTEASDSTLEGALLLATRNLEHQIRGRKSKPLGQSKIPPQPRALSQRGR
jgi:ribosome-associated translation inhibitor RaiA